MKHLTIHEALLCICHSTLNDEASICDALTTLIAFVILKLFVVFYPNTTGGVNFA